MLLFGFYALFETFKSWHQNHKFLNVSIAFFSLLLVYGLLRSYTAEVYYIVDGYLTYRVQNPNEFLAQILLSFLPLFIFYYIFSQGYLSFRAIQMVCWALLGIYAVKFSVNAISLISNHVMMTNNVAYDLVSLLPLTFFVSRKQWIQFVYLFANILLIIPSIKRGAIITAGVFTIIYLYYGIMKYNGNKKIIQVILSGIVGLLCIYLFVDQFVSNSSFANKFIGMSQGDGSGRSEMYQRLWDFFINQNDLIGFLFGHGLDYSIHINSNLAHQDWLELAVDTGLCGIVLYVLWYKELYYDIRTTENDFFKYILISCFAIMIFKSMFSMCFYSMGIGLPLAIAYALTNSQDEQSQ